MPEVEEIERQIRTFILKRFPLAKRRQIADDESLLEDGILDSLGVLDLVNFIEETFQLILGDDDILPENFDSVRRMTVFVENKLRGESSTGTR